MTVSHIQHNCKEELNRAELRATPARIAVMQLLESTKKPVDATTIMEYLEKENIETDPVTVFRIMNILSEKGLAKRIQFFEGKTRYELAAREDHHHLVCLQCGNIWDIVDRVLPGMIDTIQKEHDFLVRNHSLEFFGLCANCKNNYE